MFPSGTQAPAVSHPQLLLGLKEQKDLRVLLLLIVPYPPPLPNTLCPESHLGSQKEDSRQVGGTCHTSRGGWISGRSQLGRGHMPVL